MLLMSNVQWFRPKVKIAWKTGLKELQSKIKALKRKKKGKIDYIIPLENDEQMSSDISENPLDFVTQIIQELKVLYYSNRAQECLFNSAVL